MAQYTVMHAIDEKTTGYISEAKLGEFLTERFKGSLLADFRIKVGLSFVRTSSAKCLLGGARQMGVLCA
jgi:hypothetical protein